MGCPWPGAIVLTEGSFETLAIALRCPPTPNQACLDRIGEHLHADHYVWATMAKEKAGEVTADVRLWSRGKPAVDARVGARTGHDRRRRR